MLKVEDIPMDDPETFRMLSQGKNIGVFQLGKSWIRGHLRDVQPDCFSDIVALLAMVRPGSLDTGGAKAYARNKRSGRTTPDIHPELNAALEPVLKETYGVILYQEQVLEIIKIVTGWGYAEADLIFYAMRKKDLGKLSEAKPSFQEASKYSPEATETVWNILVAFGDYGFNKAHAVSYAKITMWTAYLKCHYPKEFLAALLSYPKGKDADEKKRNLQDMLNAVKEEDIRVLPPDINESDLGFKPTPEGVRYGIGAIKGVGEATTRGILRTRPFKDLDDFLWRVDPSVLNSGVLAALIKSGCLDSLWSDRSQILGEIDRLSALALSHRKAQSSGSGPLTRIRYELKAQPSSGRGQSSEIAAWEDDTIGVRLTYPRVVILCDKILSESEREWLMSVLKARPPESEVYLSTKGYESKLPLRTSAKGLETVLSKIQLKVEIR